MIRIAVLHNKVSKTLFTKTLLQNSYFSEEEKVRSSIQTTVSIYIGQIFFNVVKCILSETFS